MQRDEGEALLRTAGWPEPRAMFDRSCFCWSVYSGVDLRGRGETLRDAIKNAGVHVPDVSQFAAIKATVVLGGETVATCRSSTMAQRISNALNRYKPNGRGV